MIDVSLDLDLIEEKRKIIRKKKLNQLFIFITINLLKLENITKL